MSAFYGNSPESGPTAHGQILPFSLSAHSRHQRGYNFRPGEFKESALGPLWLSRLVAGATGSHRPHPVQFLQCVFAAKELALYYCTCSTRAVRYRTGGEIGFTHVRDRALRTSASPSYAVSLDRLQKLNCQRNLSDGVSDVLQRLIILPFQRDVRTALR
jgi:hypothetical protein